MIPKKLKSLIDEYCMGVTPTDQQMDEIMDMAFALNADSAEVSKYMNKMISGPTKEEREKEKKIKAEKAKAAAKKKAQEEAEKREKEAAEQRALERIKQQIIENSKQPYVDLGLSVKWATNNLGASIPTEDGDYYAWGETESKQRYDWSTYEHCCETDDTIRLFNAKTRKSKTWEYEITYYCTNELYGDVDDVCVLEPDDDAATANLVKSWKFWKKEKWRTPTKEEWQELLDNCKLKWTNLQGKEGYVVIGKNGNAIFLPAAGIKEGTKTFCHGGERDSKATMYWSSSLEENCYNAYAFDECPSNPLHKLGDNNMRCYGMPIRPVCE